MRTTITLDADVAALVDREMRQRGTTFKEVVNAALRRGLDGSRARRRPIHFTTYDMGEPRIDLTHALRVAAAMEDEAILDTLRQGR